MVQVAKEHDCYLADFERFAQGAAAWGPSWLNQVRTAALSHFAALGFPTTRQEEWKYTNVAPIAKTSFTLPPPERNGVTANKLRSITLVDIACAQLVFVNGRYAPELSLLGPLLQGVRVGSLAAVLRTDPHKVESYLARYAGFQGHAFVALNTAFLEDGAFVFIPQGTVLDAPLHLLFLSTTCGEPIVSYPRNLIVIDPESQATIVESYVGLGNEVYFTNAVTELIAGEHAVIDHTRVQLESPEAFHMATLQVQQGRSSTVVSHTIALGGALVRNEVNAVLDGEGGDCTLNGLYLVTGQQHVDNHTQIDHVQAHCTSHELYKGVLDGRARGVFNGKIIVHKTAAKTEATQTNKNLLLSGDALVDSKPQLEIFNNDVRCTHGSTIGKLDQDALFYLRTRGLDIETARGLLTYAFVSEVLDRIKVESLRVQLEERFGTQLYTGKNWEGVL
jgi:Fe-S cluster assembly protein SufD